jgi:hypothetical protein
MAESTREKTTSTSTPSTGEQFPLITLPQKLPQTTISRYYVDTTVSTLLLLILICLTFGLFYGFCGKKVDPMYGSEDYCCNKGTGGRYLMA